MKKPLKIRSTGAFKPRKSGLVAGLLTAFALGLPGCTKNPTKPNQAPVAAFTATPTQGYSPLDVDFDASQSYDPDGSISRYNWDFDSDGITDAEGVQASHIFTNPGTYNTKLTVEDDKGEVASKTLEVLASDGSPIINVQNFLGYEDVQSEIDLSDIDSPFYDRSQINVQASSPNLDVIINGNEASIINSTPDWNGNTYIDITATDQDGRETTKRINGLWAPQTDVSGDLEEVLTGNKISDLSVDYKTKNMLSDVNGYFKFQVPTSNDTLRINSDQFYNYKSAILANGQDIDLGRIQMIKRNTDPDTAEDLLDFMKFIGPFHSQTTELVRPNLPMSIYLDNNPPSQAYRDSTEKGLDMWKSAANQHLNESRKLNLFQIINNLVEEELKVDYSGYDYNGDPLTTDGKYSYQYKTIYLNPNMHPIIISRVAAHEIGHSEGLGKHSPYSQHIMHSPIYVEKPSSFEGLVIATIYNLQNGTKIGNYNK